MPANDFKEMNFFLASLIEIGLKPIVFNVIDENDFEVKLESGGKILFGKKQSLSSILTTYNLFLNQKNLIKIIYQS